MKPKILFAISVECASHILVSFNIILFFTSNNVMPLATILGVSSTYSVFVSSVPDIFKALIFPYILLKTIFLSLNGCSSIVSTISTFSLSTIHSLFSSTMFPNNLIFKSLFSTYIETPKYWHNKSNKSLYVILASFITLIFI